MTSARSPQTAFERSYDHLRKAAVRMLAAERPDHTLQPTALVHEAWLRLAAERTAQDLSPQQFQVLASHVMRHVLTDHARRRRRRKRDGLQLDREQDIDGQTDAGAALVVEVDRALEQLQRLDPELAELVELRFFGGHSLESIAELTQLSLRTLNRRWQLARAWLAEQIDISSWEPPA